MKLDILSEVTCQLKDVVRTGWELRGVKNPESVADHSYGLCLLTLMLCPTELDRLKCLEFAIVHDLAESITGDHVPAENILPADKHNAEMQAIESISQLADCPRLVDLFAEYERQDTPEAVFIKQMDKLDMVLQARYYDRHGRCNYYQNGKKYHSLFEEFSTGAGTFIEDILQKL